MIVSYYIISATFMIGGLTLWKSVSSRAPASNASNISRWLIRSFAALLWTCAIVINYHLYIFGVASNTFEADEMFLPFFKNNHLKTLRIVPAVHTTPHRTAP